MLFEQVLKTLEARREESVAELQELLRIPSVSAQEKHQPDMERCAQWLVNRLRGMGLEAAAEPTGGHPVVLGRTAHRADRPTVLLYGHYDVQPVEPLDEWTSPPFEPAVRDGAIYARGACDDKGQVWAHLSAIEAWQRHGGLPVNLIILIEGEEEVSSVNLPVFLERNKERLKADVAVISDTSQFARGVPAITTGLKGLVYLELIVRGPNRDLHSGLYGGTVANPANVLCRLIASLHDEQGRVSIPGFYDDVRSLAEAERTAWRTLPFDEKEFLADLGLSAGSGERGFSTIERAWGRPTCDVNGLSGGYQQKGAKTIIPATASAKVSMRLVADQDPLKIKVAFERVMRQRCPAGVQLEILDHGHGDPVLVPMDSPATRLAAEAVRIGFGAEPAFIRSGGSIPVVGAIKRVLGLDALLVGFGLPDDRLHSPNEKFDLASLYGGQRTAAALYEKLARLGSR